MSKVHRLDSSTINKIAAGEVLERPASCVKELVENAIDAGATRIEVEIQSGGKSFIRVTDNGIGMNMEDACLSICRHATSKISNADDLNGINTLGFRGEALPSIMSVSNFSIRTRTEDSELGTSLKLNGGLDQEVQEVGCPVGTTVQVQDLFFNTPARKKFLKTNNTEGAKIHDFIVKLALSRPSIAFKFINGNRNDINTPGSGSLFDTITSIYGSDVANELLEVDFTDVDDQNFHIRGYISKPNLIKSYRSWQTFIVNGRVISNRIIARAVDDAYRSLIPKSGYPLAILVFDIPAQSIDVNVHPQKTEIRFEDEGKLYQTTFASINQSIDEKTFAKYQSSEELQNVAVTPDIFNRPKSNSAIGSRQSYSQGDYSRQNYPRNDYSKIDIDPLENFKKYNIGEVRELLNEHSMSKTNTNDNINDISDKNPEINAKHSELSSSTNPNSSFLIPNSSLKMIPIGQVDLCYIIAKSEDSLYIVDQHAAHERILFDRFAGYTDAIPAQQLLVHQILSFDEHEAQLVENNLELFHSLGFTMEQSGDNEYRLMEIPADIDNSDAEGMLREILSSLPPVDEAVATDEQQQTIARNIRQSCLAVTACRAAVKAGQELNFRQMQIILDQLAKTAHPFTCPHGRPTIIKFSSQDLAKMFKRTGF